jgi:hypothetical protein
MTKGDLTEILGSEMIRPTKHPTVVELRPKGIFSDHGTRLERLIDVLLASYPRMFYCPHEPDEGERSGARYRQWAQVEANTWEIPRGATANEVMHDPAYLHGWTIYSGPAPLSESDWQRGVADRVVLLAELIRIQTVVVVVVSDPDGTPWLVGLADPHSTTK